MNAASERRFSVTSDDRLSILSLYAFNKYLFVERFDYENWSHGISDLQKAAEEGFSNLVLKAFCVRASGMLRAMLGFGPSPNSGLATKCSFHTALPTFEPA